MSFLAWWNQAMVIINTSYLKVKNKQMNGNYINSFMKGAACRANQWTGFYMITASVMKELTHFSPLFYFHTS